MGVFFAGMDGDRATLHDRGNPYFTPSMNLRRYSYVTAKVLTLRAFYDGSSSISCVPYSNVCSRMSVLVI